MLIKLISILENLKSIDGWLIGDKVIKSAELFFVGNNLDMNRSKKVHHANVTVYKDFELDGKKYKGSASAKVSPAMSEKELEGKIEQLALAAALIKNPYYELVKPTDESIQQIKSTFSIDSLSSFMPKLVNALYKEDKFDNGKINSCEFFLEKIETKILNSFGVDESYTSYKGQIELIVDWKETGEEVEIIEIIDFSDFAPNQLEKIAAETLENARLRAIAKSMPRLSDIPIILRRENVNEFLRYYVEKANAMLVYQKYSSAKIGDSCQSEDIIGDKINVCLLPKIENSVMSRCIDADGIKLHETTLYKDGVLINYHGDNRYSQYLGIKPTGAIGNVYVEGGEKTLDELRKGPYLELHYFSDFQMDEWTGDFGGEIRLGIYFDGEKERYITGGSISGNIKDVDMYLSKDVQTKDNYICPKAIKLLGVTIAS